MFRMLVMHERLRFARNLAGISQGEVARLAGLDGGSGHLTRIESGAVRPSMETIGAVARVLGLDLNWLTYGNGVAPTRSSTALAVAKARDRIDGAPTPPNTVQLPERCHGALQAPTLTRSANEE